MSYEFIGSEKIRNFIKGVAEQTGEEYTLHYKYPAHLSMNLDYFGNIVFVGPQSSIFDKQDYWDLVNSVKRHQKFCAAIQRDEHSLPGNNKNIDLVIKSGSRDPKTHVPLEVIAEKLNRFFTIIR